VITPVRHILGLLFALLLCAPLAAASTTQPTVRSTLKASGDSTQLLIAVSGKVYVLMPEYTSAPAGGQATAVFRRAANSTHWDRLTAFEGYVVDLTVHRGQAAVLTDSGGWRRVFLGGSTRGIDPPPGYSLELLAGTDDTLLAVARKDGLRRLLLLSRAAWIDIDSLPSEISPTAPVSLAIVAGRAVLAAVAEPATGNVLVFDRAVPAPPTTRPATPDTSPTQPDRGWMRIGQFVPTQPAVALRVLDLAGKVAVWADPGETTGGGLYFAASGFDPARRADLGKHNGEIASAAERLRFFYSYEADDRARDVGLQEQVHDFSGATTGPPTPVKLPIGLSPEQQLAVALQWVVLAAIVLGVILSWRNRAAMTRQTLEAAVNLPLAGRFWRILAALIDFSPYAVMMTYLATSHTSVVDSSPLPTVRELVLWLLAIAFVITYTTISELIFGRTVGKLVMGLRVTGIDGLPARPAAVLVRNLLKGPEMVLPLSLLSILISPLRQSLGDGAAGTLVLTDDVPQPSDPEDNS
jgi:uncharacterized RDD family membrane protein YckC